MGVKELLLKGMSLILPNAVQSFFRNRTHHLFQGSLQKTTPVSVGLCHKPSVWPTLQRLPLSLFSIQVKRKEIEIKQEF